MSALFGVFYFSGLPYTLRLCVRAGVRVEAVSYVRAYACERMCVRILPNALLIA